MRVVLIMCEPPLLLGFVVIWIADAFGPHVMAALPQQLQAWPPGRCGLAVLWILLIN
jgi:hypothetical protein